MKSGSLVAALAIAALFGVSIAAVFLLTGEPRSTGSRTVAVEAEALPAAAPMPPPIAIPPPSRAPPWPEPIAVGPAWKAPVHDPPSPLVAGRVIRKRVLHALRAAPVRSRLARCVDRDVGFGGVAAPGPIPRGKPAVLLLELEPAGGAVRIADVQVRDWGGASESTVSCARDVLRGEVIAASTIPRGERTWMPFPLNPRSEAVAVSR
jgi:hypothetical protein